MKNILLTAVLSIVTFFSVLAYLDENEPVEIQKTLPAVEIKAKSIPKDTIEITLPEVAVPGKRIKFTSCAAAQNRKKI